MRPTMASHAVAPLLEFYSQDGGLDYLTRAGQVPPAAPPVLGRDPTPAELVSAATTLPGYRSEVHRSERSVEIQLDRDDGQWTFICTIRYVN